MIGVVIEDDLVKPVMICDLCDRRIRNAGLAAYMWEVSPQTGDLKTGTVFALHKGECMTVFEQVNGGRMRWYWEEMQRLPDALAANMTVDEPAKRRPWSPKTSTVPGVGDRVRSPRLGDGWVLERLTRRGDAELKVAFDKVGVKRVLASLAGLEVVS